MRIDRSDENSESTLDIEDDVSTHPPLESCPVGEQHTRLSSRALLDNNRRT